MRDEPNARAPHSTGKSPPGTADPTRTDLLHPAAPECAVGGATAALTEARAVTPPPPRASLGALFLAFARVGLLAFGGGPSTLVLMQQEVMRRRVWLNAREFGFTFALSRMYPGAHLLAQAVLIGYLLRGMRGAAICLVGLILPSCLITLLFTLGFVTVRANVGGAAVIDGILPATAGLTVAVALGLGRETLGQDRGRAKLVTAGLLIGSFALMGLLGVQSALCVLLAGIAGALLYRGAAAGSVHDAPSDRPPA